MTRERPNAFLGIRFIFRWNVGCVGNINWLKITGSRRCRHGRATFYSCPMRSKLFGQRAMQEIRPRLTCGDCRDVQIAVLNLHIRPFGFDMYWRLSCLISRQLKERCMQMRMTCVKEAPYIAEMQRLKQRVWWNDFQDYGRLNLGTFR